MLDGAAAGAPRRATAASVARRERTAEAWWRSSRTTREALFDARAAPPIPPPRLERAIEHPIFGPLNWRETLLFMRLHDLDHAGQLQKIAAALGPEPPDARRRSRCASPTTTGPTAAAYVVEAERLGVD